MGAKRGPRFQKLVVKFSELDGAARQAKKEQLRAKLTKLQKVKNAKHRPLMLRKRLLKLSLVDEETKRARLHKVQTRIDKNKQNRRPIRGARLQKKLLMLSLADDNTKTARLEQVQAKLTLLRKELAAS